MSGLISIAIVRVAAQIVAIISGEAARNACWRTRSIDFASDHCFLKILKIN